MHSGPQTPPHSLGSGWLVNKVFSEIFLLLKGGKKKHKQNSRKPKSDLVQALEHLWHWPPRKSSCASGRNLRSGPQGPGSAGPRSCLRGWARVRATGGQSCVSGHPVGSSAGGCGHWARDRVPGALLRSPVERSRPPGRHGRKMEWKRKRSPRARGRGFRLESCLCHSSARRLGEEEFFFCEPVSISVYWG